MVQRSIKNPHRNLKNKTTLEVQELEKGNPSLEDVLFYTSGKRQKKCYDSGDVEGGVIPCGEDVGRIHDIPTVKEVIDEVVVHSEELLKEMSR